MDFILRYIKLEFKRAYKAFPKMLLSSITLILIIGSLAYCGEKLLYANEEHDKAKVALVIEDDSSLISMATTLLESSNSISTVANFVKVSPSVAEKLMKEKSVIATLTIPDGFIKGLMEGNNLPINVEFSQTMHAFTGIFSELSLTATQTMASTQAGIYSQHDMYHAHNISDKLDNANKELNTKYLNFVFTRDSIFKTKTVTSTGNVSMGIYYLSGAIVLFFMMFSMSFNSFIMNDSKTLKQKLYTSKVGTYGYYASKILIVFSMYYCTFILLGIIGLFININLLKLFICIIPTLLCLATIVVLFFEISPNRLTAIILVFILSCSSAILSGCVIPTSYLPDTLEKIGSVLPTTAMITTIASGMNSGVNFNSLVYLLITAIICYLLTILYEKKARC